MFPSILSAFGETPRRYVTESVFSENRTKQILTTPQTLEQLRKYGVTDDTELKLEFFFYTNEEAKASELAAVLMKKGYSVRHMPAAHDETLQVITGWTEKMKMTDAVVVAWTREMCELGYASDCNFDGWGTTPKQ
jgi:regulator of RNase E activity RraB